MLIEVPEVPPTLKKSAIRILHVDDDLSLLETSKLILSIENDYEIDNVTSVDEAFKKIAQQPYDAIVSDYEMPQKNGLDFLKTLREQKNDIAFIIFTGRGREEIAVKALNLGADRYLDKNGAPEVVYCELAHAINKIVERKKAEKDLRKSEARYRELANFLPEIVFEADLAGKITFFNLRAFEKTGYTPEELEKGMNILTFLVPEEHEKAKQNIKMRLTGGDPGSVEYTLLRKNGSTYPAIVKIAPLIYENKVTGLRGVATDITERKQAEDILKRDEEKYRELANSLPIIVYESDLTGKVEFVNNKGLEIAQMSNEDFEKGLNILQFITPEDRPRAMERMKQYLAGARIIPAEYMFQRKDETTFPAIITTTLHTSQNKVTGFSGTVLDISELKKTEKSLKQTMNELAIINEKLAVVGGLTRHDVRNKLSVISGNIYLAKKKYADIPGLIQNANTRSRFANFKKHSFFSNIKATFKIGFEPLSQLLNRVFLLVKSHVFI